MISRVFLLSVAVHTRHSRLHQRAAAAVSCRSRGGSLIICCARPCRPLSLTLRRARSTSSGVFPYYCISVLFFWAQGELGSWPGWLTRHPDQAAAIRLPASGQDLPLPALTRPRRISFRPLRLPRKDNLPLRSLRTNPPKSVTCSRTRFCISWSLTRARDGSPSVLYAYLVIIN